jgi:dTDP-glucose pyrophosphorylase
MSLNIIIPVAGKGSRFANAGYEVPKPLIVVDGKTLMEHSINTLGFSGHFIFITRTFDDPSHNEQLTKIFEENCDSFLEVRIDDEHLGAAHTALFAEKYLDPEDELIITNCDQYLDWDGKDFLVCARGSKADGSVVTYKSTDIKNSFVVVKSERVTKIAEKVQISDEALIGVHYWKHGKYFFDSARKLMSEYKDLGYLEAYVAPTYGYLLEEKIVNIYRLHPNQYWPLGTPEDVDRFLMIHDFERSYLGKLHYNCSVQGIEPFSFSSASGEINGAKLVNVLLSNKKQESSRGKVVVKSKAFLFDIGCSSYFHGLSDVLGQFSLLKQKFPDIRAFAFTDGEEHKNIKPFMETIGEDLCDLKIFSHDLKEVLFEEVYLFSAVGFPWFLNTFREHNRKIRNLTVDNNIYNNVYMKEILSAARKSITIKLFDPKSAISTINSNKDKKIFLHSAHKSLFDNPKSTSAEKEQFEKQKEQMIRDGRFIKKSDYLNIVKVFKDLGYVDVDPSKLTMAEQIGIVTNANQIATIAGSNSTHSIYSSGRSSFILINPFLKYDFPHESIVSLCNKNPIFIDNSENIEMPDFIKKIKELVLEIGEQNEEV